MWRRLLIDRSIDWVQGTATLRVEGKCTEGNTTHHEAQLGDCRKHCRFCCSKCLDSIPQEQPVAGREKLEAIHESSEYQAKKWGHYFDNRKNCILVILAKQKRRTWKKKAHLSVCLTRSNMWNWIVLLG